MCVATTTAISIGTIAATSGAAAYSAHKASSSANNSAKLQTQSANYAADIQAQAGREALAYTKEQAKLDEGRYETDRRANYDQWNAGQQNTYNTNAARERRLGSLGELVGAGPREIPGLVMPDYVPSSGPTAPGPAKGGGSEAAWSAFDKLFPGETLTPQMLTENKAALEGMGFALRPNAAGVVGKIQFGNEPIADVIQGAGSGLNKKQRLYGGGGAAAAPPGTARPRLAPDGTSLAFTNPNTATPALTVPAYRRPRSLYDYLET